MRFIDLKIRTKLYLAFGVLILIGVVLSINSLYTMWNLENDVETMTEEYLPEMKLATDISNKTQQVAFYMEGYFLTGKPGNYQKAKAELESLKQVIVTGEQLLSGSGQSSILEEKLSVIRMLIPKYEQIMLMAFKSNQDLTILRSQMNEVEAKLLNVSEDYFKRQNDLLYGEIRRNSVRSSRQQKLLAINNILKYTTLIHEDAIKASTVWDKSLFEKILNDFTKLNDALERLKSLDHQTESQQLLVRIENEMDAYHETLGAIKEKIDVLSAYGNEHQELSSHLVEDAIDLRDSGIENSIRISESFTQKIISSIRSKVIIVFIAIAIAIFLTIFMARLITGPIDKGIEFVKQMARGDLTVDLDVDQQDEIGELSENLKVMGEQIRDIITAVTVAADNMASASMELSSTSQHVSQGASEQASSAEEVSSSIEEMAANIQQNTQNAKDMVDISAKAESDILNGKEKVDKTVLAIRKIADKISIIGDIAFQTNILALNAAVEAARAGEHGRGFGVVAAEVGKLAERSKIAAQEIDELTKTSVFNAEEAGKIMNEIVPDINKTSSLIQGIAAASVQQNSGADQINFAIQQLNQVTQQNAAASEELATNAVEMSSQAESLQEIVSFFKVVIDEEMTRKKKKTSIVPKLKAAGEKVKNETKGVILNLDEDEDDEFEKF